MHGRLPLLFMLLALLPFSLYGQAASTPSDGDQKEAPLGGYSLVITTLEPSGPAHLLNPPITLALDAATQAAPKEDSGTKAVPPEFMIDSIGSPQYDCVSTVARDRGCDAIDRAAFTVRDPNTIAYHLLHHGSPAQLTLNVQVRDRLPVSRTDAKIQWHPRDVIFVTVPKPTPYQHVLSATLIGDWNGDAIVVEPGKPLSAAAKKGLDDLGIHEDIGDKIVYSYRVKDPVAKDAKKTK